MPSLSPVNIRVDANGRVLPPDGPFLIQYGHSGGGGGQLFPNDTFVAPEFQASVITVPARYGSGWGTNGLMGGFTLPVGGVFLFTAGIMISDGVNRTGLQTLELGGSSVVHPGTGLPFANGPQFGRNTYTNGLAYPNGSIVWKCIAGTVQLRAYQSNTGLVNVTPSTWDAAFWYFNCVPLFLD